MGKPPAATHSLSDATRHPPPHKQPILVTRINIGLSQQYYVYCSTLCVCADRCWLYLAMQALLRFESRSRLWVAVLCIATFFCLCVRGSCRATTVDRVCGCLCASPQLPHSPSSTLRVTLPRTSQLALRGTTHRLGLSQQYYVHCSTLRVCAHRCWLYLAMQALLRFESRSRLSAVCFLRTAFFVCVWRCCLCDNRQ